jgi:hypothetical protein
MGEVMRQEAMRAAIGFVVVGALAGTSAVKAQVKTLTGETSNMTATVEAIDQSRREVTLKKEDGTYHVLKVPADVKRLEELKVGDTVKVRSYENIVLRLKQPGEPDVDTASKSTTPAAGGQPAGTMAGQRTITATITAIDPSVPSITFSGPNKWSYSSKVQDTAALAKVKVGDRVDITWTDATLVSWEPLK